MNRPDTSIECGMLVLDAFRTNTLVRSSFEHGISVLKTAFPTKYNQNKFVVGMAVERMFVECLSPVFPLRKVSLCSNNEKRNDINVFSYAFSLKYTTPLTSGKLGNVRLINVHTGTDKKYEVNEDTFIIVPNATLPKDKIFNPDTQRLQLKTTKTGKKAIEKYGEQHCINLALEKLMGKLIFIPKETITPKDLKQTNDGIELSSSFLNEFINTEENSKFIVPLDIHNDQDTEPMDIIRLACEACLKCQLVHC
jgi:hypothetical protein